MHAGLIYPQECVTAYISTIVFIYFFQVNFMFNIFSRPNDQCENKSIPAVRRTKYRRTCYLYDKFI